MKNLINETVRLTVITENGRKGTITYPDYDGEKVIGSYQENIQFKENGEKMGFNGTVKEIEKIEVYKNMGWIEA